MRLIFTAAMIAASIAGSALANPDAPPLADHFRPGPEWRAYWVCARRATKVMTNKELSARNAFPQVEAVCSAEKAAFLLAQIDSVPREQRATIARYVDVVCEVEAMTDVLAIETYRDASGGVSSAPSTWDDPKDPLNR
jgi:hypothetical protein